MLVRELSVTQYANDGKCHAGPENVIITAIIMRVSQPDQWAAIMDTEWSRDPVDNKVITAVRVTL